MLRAVLVALCLLLLCAGTTQAAQPLRWAKKRVTVYDYTTHMGPYVQIKVDEWNVALDVALRLRYERMDPTPCEDVQPRKGTIVVCNVTRGPTHC